MSLKHLIVVRMNRCAAITLLAIICSSQAVAQSERSVELAELLQGDRAAKENAGQIIAANPKEFLPILRQLAQQANPNGRSAAIVAGMHLPATELLELAADASHYHRDLIDAIQQRVNIDDPKEPKHISASQACPAIVKLGREGAAPAYALRSLDEIRRRHPQTSVTEAELLLLVDMLGSKKITSRKLGETEHDVAMAGLATRIKQVQPRLFEIAKESHGEKLLWLIMLIGREKPYHESVIDYFVELTEHDEAKIRHSAISGLSVVDQRYDEIAELLIQKHRTDPSARTACVFALGKVACNVDEQLKRESIDAICDGIEERKSDVTPSLSVAISTPLASIIKSCDEQSQIKWAGQMGDRMLGSPAPSAYVPVLHSLGPNAKVAVDDLKKLITRDVPLEAKLPWAFTLHHIEQNPKTVISLYSLALRADRRTSSKAVHLIRHLGPAAAELVPELTRLLEDPERRKSSYSVIRTLTAIGPKSAPAIPAMLKTLEGKHPSYQVKFVAEAMEAIGPEASAAVPQLIEAANKEDKNSFYAIKALGSIGPKAKAALPDLQKLRNSKRRQITSAAERAIALIER